MEDLTTDITMNQTPFISALFNEMPCGAALNKIICDTNGVAVDYITTEVNPFFTVLLNVKPESIIGKRASLHLTPDELHHWLEIFGPVALDGKTVSYSMNSPQLGYTFYCTAMCPQKGSFFVMFAVTDEVITKFTNRERPSSRDL